ncbi:MAG: hypothetical protein ACRBCL_07415 [Maritimibacter sp.]
MTVLLLCFCCAGNAGTQGGADHCPWRTALLIPAAQHETVTP